MAQVQLEQQAGGLDKVGELADKGASAFRKRMKRLARDEPIQQRVRQTFPSRDLLHSSQPSSHRGSN